MKDLVVCGRNGIDWDTYYKDPDSLRHPITTRIKRVRVRDGRLHPLDYCRSDGKRRYFKSGTGVYYRQFCRKGFLLEMYVGWENLNISVDVRLLMYVVWENLSRSDDAGQDLP